MALVDKRDTATLNNQYKVIFENSPLGIFHYSINGIILEYNQKFLDIISASDNNLHGINIFDIIKDQKVLNVFKDALNEDTYFYEGQYFSAITGKSIYLRLNINRITNDEGEVVGAVAMMEDLTSKIKKDNEYRILTEVAEKSPLSIVITNEKKEIIYTNRFFSILSGYSFDEVKGKNPEFLGDELNSKDVYDELWEELNCKGKWEGILVNRKKCGGTYYTKSKILTVTDNEGCITNYIAIKEDISLNIESEEKLRISESNFKNVVDNAGEMIIVISKGKPVYVNKELLKCSGYTLKEFQDNHFLQFVHPEDIPKLKKNYLSRLAGKTLNDKYEIRAITKWGEVREVEIIAKDTIFNGIPTLIVIMRDITEKMLMEKELIDARNKAEESDKLKSTFLATLSHELRTPLNHVIGFSNLLEDEDINTSAKAYSRMIYNSSVKLLSIIEDIFTFIGLEQGQLSQKIESVSLFEIFNRSKLNLQKLLNRKEKIDALQLKFRPDPHYFDLILNTDVYQLDLIFKNLFNNAVKFTVSGYIEFGYNVLAESELLFYIKDTGIGIPESKRDIIFDYFRQAEEEPTRNFGGVGLGLSLSKKIAKSLNGDIFFTINEEGGGTTFYLKLPIHI